jgi:hypothetical protein
LTYGNHFQGLNTTCNHFLNNHIFGATLRRVAVSVGVIIVQPNRFPSDCRLMQLRDTFAMTVGAQKTRRIKAQRIAIRGVAAFAFSFLSGVPAYAVSDNVKHACRDDYFQHCSQYAVGSEELRQCMRKVGEDLSTPCLVALVQDGEITKEDVERHNAAKAGGAKTSSAQKNADQLAAEDAGNSKVAGAKAAQTSGKGKKKKKKSAHNADGAAGANADPGKPGGQTVKNSKASKIDKTGLTSKSTKKSGKKSKKANATSAAATGTGSKAAADATAAPKAKKTATGATSKSAKKKKAAGTGAKSKKTAKKASANVSGKKSDAGQTP